MNKEIKQVKANLEYLKEIVDTQNRIGVALWTEFKVAYQRIVNLPHQGS